MAKLPMCCNLSSIECAANPAASQQVGSMAIETIHAKPMIDILVVAQELN